MYQTLISTKWCTIYTLIFLLFTFFLFGSSFFFLYLVLFFIQVACYLLSDGVYKIFLEEICFTLTTERKHGPRYNREEEKKNDMKTVVNLTFLSFWSVWLWSQQTRINMLTFLHIQNIQVTDIFLLFVCFI